MRMPVHALVVGDTVTWQTGHEPHVTHTARVVDIKVTPSFNGAWTLYYRTEGSPIWNGGPMSLHRDEVEAEPTGDRSAAA